MARHSKVERESKAQQGEDMTIEGQKGKESKRGQGKAKKSKHRYLMMMMMMRMMMILLTMVGIVG